MKRRDTKFLTLQIQQAERQVLSRLRSLCSLLFTQRGPLKLNSRSKQQIVASSAQETERLEALEDYKILDTLPESAFDDLTALATYICGTSIALISLLDADRQWFKSKVGISVDETPRDWAFCAHAILKPNEILVIPDATQDDRFADNPLVTSQPNIRFYAGAPLITPDGLPLGTLCVIDTVPRTLTVEQLEALRCLSRQTITQMELLKEIRRRQEAEQQIKALSLTDDLTQLHNRRGFFLLAEQQLKLARRIQARCWVVFIDLDGLKQVNDAWGHGCGDRMLIAAAQLLKQSFRDSDIVARLSGDEFAIFVSGFSGSAIDIHLRVQTNILQFNQKQADQRCQLSMSMGVECIDPNSDISLAAALTKADELMYISKRLKRCPSADVIAP